jgi:hypothetical protein
MSNMFLAFYAKHFGNKEVTQELFDTDYVTVAFVEAEGKEDAFVRLQGEVWSPNGEQREYIESLGLSHTSMSVGDILYALEENKFFLVEDVGFTEVPLTA